MIRRFMYIYEHEERPAGEQLSVREALTERAAIRKLTLGAVTRLRIFSHVPYANATRVHTLPETERDKLLVGKRACKSFLLF